MKPRSQTRRMFAGAAVMAVLSMTLWPAIAVVCACSPAPSQTPEPQHACCHDDLGCHDESPLDPSTESGCNGPADSCPLACCRPAVPLATTSSGTQASVSFSLLSASAAWATPSLTVDSTRFDVVDSYASSLTSPQRCALLGRWLN